jgi:hypothetical protein
MNPTRHIRVMFKGNQDLKDALLSREKGGAYLETGLEEMLHQKYPKGLSIEWLWEPSGGFDVLCQSLQRTPALPPAWQGADPWVQAQIETDIPRVNPDILILSILPDLLLERWEHPESGLTLVAPAEASEDWTFAREAGLRHIGRLPAGTFQKNFRAAVEALQKQIQSHLIVIGASSLVPGDQVHNYAGLPETIAYRAQAANLALLEVSSSLGISIVDVDRLVAEEGGIGKIPSAFQYSPEVYARVSAEAFRIVEDAGNITSPELQKIVLPYIDRQVERGLISRWYKQPGESIEYGDPLFDVQVEEIVKVKRVGGTQIQPKDTVKIRKKNLSFIIQVLASSSGILREVYTRENQPYAVGEPLALVSGPDWEPGSPVEMEALPVFRLATNLVE